MVKDLQTSRHDRNQPDQVGYVYDRLVFFQVQSVCEYGLSGGDVEVLNHDRPSTSRQDGHSIGQDRKCS